jgi:hypothetical protein
MELPQVDPSELGKRKRDENEIESTNEDTRTTEEILSEIRIITPPVLPSRPPLLHGTGIYWESTEADKLFNASQDENAHSRIQDMIVVLENATKLPLVGYKSIIEGHDADDTLSEYRKHDIQMKALYLLAAYKEAKEEMPFKTWSKCCRDAIESMSKAGINYISNDHVLQRWNIEFRKDKMFHPKCRAKHDLPPFLEAHPCVVSSMKQFGRANLSDLLIDLMHSHLHDTVLKSLVAERLIRTRR